MIPDKVKIGGITYDVLMVDEPSEDRDSNGRIDYAKQTMKVKVGMAQEYTEKVFLHEVMHGIVSHCEIDFGGKDEDIVHRITNALHQVLKDNDINFRVPEKLHPPEKPKVAHTGSISLRGDGPPD